MVFARLLKEIGNDEVRIDLLLDADRDATRICFALADHPGIFSRLAGALALVGANVVDARTYTSKDGYATAVFWVQDADGRPYRREPRASPRLRGMIDKTLKGEVVAREARRAATRSRSANAPSGCRPISPSTTKVRTSTRSSRSIPATGPGLLYDLTRTLAAAHVYIASAVIATYGEQVVDSFYVKDMFGLKFHSEAKQKSLEKRLRDAIERGAERART